MRDERSNDVNIMLGGGVITPRACAWGKLNRSVCQSLLSLLAPDLEIYAYNKSDICEKTGLCMLQIAQHGSTK